MGRRRAMSVRGQLNGESSKGDHKGGEGPGELPRRDLEVEPGWGASEKGAVMGISADVSQTSCGVRPASEFNMGCCSNSGSATSSCLTKWQLRAFVSVHVQKPCHRCRVTGI